MMMTWWWKGKTRTEAVVADFTEILSWRLSGRDEENNEDQSQTSRFYEDEDAVHVLDININIYIYTYILTNLLVAGMNHLVS
jgi:hypothetical protein